MAVKQHPTTPDVLNQHLLAIDFGEREITRPQLKYKLFEVNFQRIEKRMEPLKEGGRQIAAGGMAGLIEVCLMHPLDLVKTRFQVQRGVDDPERYRGLVDCFRRIYASEGVSGFYKGILPPILAETPKRATKFFTFEQYRWAFSSDHISPTLTLSFAGLCSGLTEAIVICPFEVVKVRLQSQRNISITQQQSTMAMARDIIRTHGYGTTGIYRGLTATLGRHGVWNMVYFGLYHNLKVYVPDAKTRPQANVSWRLILGFVAGSLASVVNIPFDVAKSRIQGPQPSVSVRKYNGCLQSIMLIYREEGFLALYKGLLPKIMRLGPGGAIMLIVYETAYDWLKNNT